MNETGKIVDYTLIAVGTSIGIADIESILGIAILIIQGIWLVVRLILAIKNKNKDEVKQVIDEGKTFIDEVKDKTNKEKDSK